MNQNEFLNQQQAAVERMREMNARSQYARNSSHQMPPAPAFVNIPQKGNQTQNMNARRPNTPTQQGSASQPNITQEEAPHPVFQTPPNKNPKSVGNSLFPGGGGLPFIDKIMKDGDAALIIGLLLILMSENADKRLLFALVYILL